MKVLFVHQNFPGQFLHLAPALAARGHDCRALTDSANGRASPIPVIRYRHTAPAVDARAARLGRNYTQMSDRGVTVARAARQLRDAQGYVPDVIVGHSGWGETLFLKQVWPDARLIVYSEFYYAGQGRDVGFDPEFDDPAPDARFDAGLIAQARAAHLGQAILHADAALAPTRWQADAVPPALRDRVTVIFDGVDTDRVRPDPTATLTLADGTTLRAGDEVLSFVNRNLEPYRGFHILMRALPEVLAARPQARVVIVGGDEVSYGRAPPGGGSWRDRMLAETGDRLDRTRVHFTGKLPYGDFLRLLQVTRVHAYLTYPFVLSWSAVEALAAGALVVGSRTPPVEEVIRHGENGLLVDFFDVAGWVAALTDALAHTDRHGALRQAARAGTVRDHDLRSVCLPRLVALVEGAG